MGEVYLARDTRLGRRVALKLLNADVTKNEERVRRFQNEARSASALNHPNIITIFDVGEIDGTHFIATEFIDGETLRQNMSHGPLPLDELLDIAIQVSTALAAAHASGIIHRDIKPDNIMVRPDGYVKVLDFGLAKLTERSGQQQLVSHPDAETQQVVQTDPGTVMGTVSYMSPEQARAIAIDERTDIFSLGVVLYELVAGRVPFEGPSISEVIVAILKKRPMPLARYAPDVPPEMERIVSKALSKERDGRYQTVKDLLIDLKRLKQQLELENELEHSSFSSGDRSASASSGGHAVAPGREPGSSTQPISVAIRPTSSAEYIITELKRHKRGTLFTLIGVILIATGLAYYVNGTKPIETIAVIPLADDGDDVNEKRLSEIITQRLINSLSKLPNIKVKSFSSVARFKDQRIDPQQIGRELGVQALLVGSLKKHESEDDILIAIELVNAKDSSQIWGEQYNRKFADLLQVQESIVRGVSEKLAPKPTEAERKKREAEQLYAEGRNYWDKRTPDALRRGIEAFQRAIEIQPDFAPAHAGLADCYNMLVSYGAAGPKEAFPKAKAAAMRALEIDDQLAEAHTALAFEQFRGEWDWPAAEREFKRAIELNYEYAQAHQWYANYLVALGRPQEAIEATKRSLSLDSTSLIVQAHLGFIAYFAHRYDDAIATSKKTLSLDPNFFPARRYLGLSYAQKGMYSEAVAEFQKAWSGAGGSPVVKAEFAHTLALAGRKEEAQKTLNELLELSKQQFISPYHIATIYAGLEDHAKALDWLEKAYEDHSDYLVYLNVDPRLDHLHGDSRFEALRTRMGLL